jgi:hypothetical protein
MLPEACQAVFNDFKALTASRAAPPEVAQICRGGMRVGANSTGRRLIFLFPARGSASLWRERGKSPGFRGVGATVLTKIEVSATNNGGTLAVRRQL